MVLPATILLTLTLAAVPLHVTASPTDPSVEARCQKDESDVFPHPELCHLYYNCANDVDQLFRGRYFEKYMEECPYPKLFDADTLSCGHYKDVDCGDRREVVDACDYPSKKCGSAHCKPCHLRYPSCEGLGDGQNAFPHREWTPWFVTCLDNRTLSTGYCRPNHTLKVIEIFSPDRGECVSLYEVPRERRGKPLDCTQKADGLHPDDVTSRPDLYFRCHGEKLVEISVCSTGKRFDKTSQQCVQS